MTVDVSGPAVEAKLIKLVDRRNEASERYNRAARIFDLTPYLGPQGSIHTQKSVNQAYGSCAITISDRLESDTLDTVMALVEPMDMIEVRATVTPHLYLGRAKPLIMRFFVTDVRRTESAGAAEAPIRTVTISGEDAGKLLQIHHVWWQVAALLEPEQAFLDVFRMQATTGVDVGFMAAGEFMKQVLQFANRKIAKLPAWENGLMRPFQLLNQVKQGLVSPNRGASFQGSIWNLLQQAADQPWNELWVDDMPPDGDADPGDERPTLIFRPTPFRDKDGNLLNGATDPGLFEMPDRYIHSINLARTDRNTANWFWVPPGQTGLESANLITVASLRSGEQFDFKHPNNNPDLYGIKKMEQATSLLPSEYAGEVEAGSNHLVNWHVLRSNQLRDMNRDNTLWEDGDLTMAGYEDAKCGQEVLVRRGGFTWRAYVTGVSHTIRALADWTTTLTLVRGTAFIERVRRKEGAMLQEVGRGPYSRTGRSQ